MNKTEHLENLIEFYRDEISKLENKKGSLVFCMEDLRTRREESEIKEIENRIRIDREIINDLSKTIAHIRILEPQEFIIPLDKFLENENADLVKELNDCAERIKLKLFTGEISMKEFDKFINDIYRRSIL